MSIATDCVMDGKLRKNEIGRWEIVFDSEGTVELSSGSRCEVKVGDHWIAVGIESCFYQDLGRSDYYATVPGVRLYRGQPARKFY